ncbi:MAG: hypothetical protein RSB90_03500 [Eubacterium sp.]
MQDDDTVASEGSKDCTIVTIRSFEVGFFCVNHKERYGVNGEE